MTATKFDHPWTLDEALDFVRHLEEWVSKVGFHVGLMGSVLTKGQSTKDLDVIIYPRDKNSHDMNSLGRMLRMAGCVMIATPEVVARRWRQLGSADSKKCIVVHHHGRRVDVFLMS